MRRCLSVVRVRSKGQIVIPAPIRRKLGLRTGQPLAVRTGNGREVAFVPIEEHAGDVQAMLGRIRAAAAKSRRDPVEELDRRRRAERERENKTAERGN